MPPAGAPGQETVPVGQGGWQPNSASQTEPGRGQELSVASSPTQAPYGFSSPPAAPLAPAVAPPPAPLAPPRLLPPPARLVAPPFMAPPVAKPPCPAALAALELPAPLAKPPPLAPPSPLPGLFWSPMEPPQPAARTPPHARTKRNARTIMLLSLQRHSVGGFRIIDTVLFCNSVQYGSVGCFGKQSLARIASQSRPTLQSTPERLLARVAP